MAKNSSLIPALVAGPIVIGIAYGVSALLTGGDAASETADAGMSMAYGLLLWIGAPIAFVAALPPRWPTKIFHQVLEKLSRVAGKRL